MCFSVRRASSCNTPQPSLNGCSASSSCYFTGHLPLSLPAYQEILWWCWREEGHCDLLGENTRWTHWEYTRRHIQRRTWPYCSLFTYHDATELARSFLLKLWLSNEFNYSSPARLVQSFEMNQSSAAAVHGRAESPVST